MSYRKPLKNFAKIRFQFTILLFCRFWWVWLNLESFTRLLAVKIREFYWLKFFLVKFYNGNFSVLHPNSALPRRAGDVIEMTQEDVVRRNCCWTFWRELLFFIRWISGTKIEAIIIKQDVLIIKYQLDFEEKCLIFRRKYKAFFQTIKLGQLSCSIRMLFAVLLNK